MRRTTLLLVLLLTALLAPSAALAQRSLTIERFHSDIRVRVGGDIDVTETIQVRFDGSWNGIFRDLSLRHETAGGRQERLDVDVRSVADAAGEPLEYESSRRDEWTRRLQIWVPGAENATHTVRIRYTVPNALRFFGTNGGAGAFDELYWQVTGTEWEVPIRRASATIYLPEGLAPLQTAAYTGTAESREQSALIDAAGNVVTVEARRSFAPGEGLTVAVGWESGVVHRPTAASETVRAVRGFWPLALPPFVFLLVFRRWKSRGRDPERRPIAVQYEPPDGLTPSEAGTLVDHTVQMHDITAMLVDLAVRGYLLIEERKESVLLGLLSDTEYVFHLRKPRIEWELAPHEREFLDALFKHGNGASPLSLAGDSASRRGSAVAGSGGTAVRVYDSIELSDLKNEFYKDLSDIRKAIYGALIRHGYYRRRPDHVRAGWIFFAAAVAGASMIAVAFITEQGFLGLHPVAVLIAGLASAVVVFGFGLVMPARTVRGARMMERALGFREFLDRVESDRYRRMITSPEMFERYLPHAMAFQVEDHWAQAFEEMYAQPPEWYHGNSGSRFRTSSFTEGLSRMSREASTTMSSSPGGSSGSGGGGSVGGGSGGGGGGGF